MAFNENFISALHDLLPREEAERLLNSLGEAPATSVRLNHRKPGIAPDCQQVPWCGNGFYLQSRPQFTFDPMLHAGLYYVQDASSMFIAHILKHLAADSDVNYLDLCAAPGGKTTAALDALSNGSLIVGNEIDNRRAQILRENIVKWGCPNCVVTNDNSAKLGKLKEFFDIIATDMPCSGEGMFRKDEEAVAQWSPSLVAQCADRQREIADNILSALKPGGFLIYSTCTFNRRENEEMVDYLVSELGAESVEIPTIPEWNIMFGIKTANHCYRFMPHRTKGEGLFIAVVQKPEGQRNTIRIKPQKSKKVVIPKECKGFIGSNYDIDFIATGELISAIPTALSERMKFIADNVHTILCGTPIATMKGKTIAPEHALALSTMLNPEAFASVELSYGNAMAYLRGEALALGDAPTGYVVARYNGIPLGFLKNIGNRANNLYPKEYRIRTTYVPSEPPGIIKTH